MWSDNESELDLLGFEHLRNAVKQTVLDEGILPVTVGIFGDWGTGKSSLASMVKADIEGTRGVVCVSHSGWLFEGYEDAKSALIGSILDALADRQRASKKAGDLIARLARRVDFFAAGKLAAKVATAMVAGADPEATRLASAVSQGLDAVTPDDLRQIVAAKSQPEENSRRGIREFRTDFAALLESTRVKNLVVFIDDLDRCLPDTVVETLEALRLFLYTPRTSFVICADERLVKAAVRHRFPQEAGAEFDVANEYLEKLVQIPVRIPPLSSSDVHRYMTLLFASNSASPDTKKKLDKLDVRELSEGLAGRQLVEKLMGRVSTDLDDSIALVDQIADVLAVGLNGNPRQIKRFLNTLVLRMTMAQSRRVTLKRRVLAKLMVLEYVRGDSFRELAEWQAGQGGRAAQLTELEAKIRRPSDVALAIGRVTDADQREPELDSTPGSDSRLARWLTDPWLANWLGSDPPLSAEDLRPYFYVSRDRIGDVIAGGLSLSPAAQQVLEGLLSPSRSIRTRAEGDQRKLSAGDAAAVCQALAERSRRAQNLDSDDSPLSSIIRLSAARPELLPEVYLLLRTLSPTSLGPGLPPRVAALRKSAGDVGPEVDELFRQWSTQKSNSSLARAAASMLARKSV